MLREDRRLRRELIWVIVLKLVVLAVLWRVFIAPKRVQVDSQRMVEVMVLPDTSVRHSGEKDAR
ncbi:cytochrome oxidase putative small subunit CydP [Gulbenkiania mobilis]|uniref:cytochrome oxidase putative small subunit CydP n=1 Tax=Gulbenkiania mobilis TaxID=397457 RepID=UPI00128ECEDE|nr:cytochrome oxidase putative small subunit CydP [Gulbenkiania mobilis]